MKEGETFTADVMQFLLPNGRKQPQKVKLPMSVKVAYEAMAVNGMRLTAEVLTTDEVSLCIEDPNRGDFLSALVTNGPDVQDALVTMLSDFSVPALVAWREAFDTDMGT